MTRMSRRPRLREHCHTARRRLTPPAWLVATLLLLVALLVATPQHARAGHYYLSDVPIEHLSPEVLSKLEQLGITSTEQLLERLVDAKGRAKIAKETRLKKAQVLDLARTLELFQIDGVGPKAARLLRASGIKSVQDLASRTPDELLARVLKVNQVQRFTGIDPDRDVIADWIQKATGVSLHVK